MSSPGVYVRERDLSQSLKSFGKTAGATVCSFEWGAVDYNVILSDEKELVTYFGKPTDENYVDWFSAFNFLNYTGSLTVRRVVNSDAKNASVDGTGLLIKNDADYQFKESTLTDTFYAKYAGDLGNSISVHVADKDTFDNWIYASEFDTAPSSSEFSQTYGNDINDEMHVIVIDEFGKFTGIPGAVLEKYEYVSKAKDGKDINNQTSYYKNVINRSSNYIYVGANISGTSVTDPSDTHQEIGDNYEPNKPFVSFLEPVSVTLSGGKTGGLADKSEYVKAFQSICALDDKEVSVVFAGGCGGDENHREVCNAIGAATKFNQYRVGFISPKISDVVGVSNEQQALDNIIETYNSITEKHSYLSMATGVKRIYDKYNDAYRWIPTNSDEAGVWARIHNTEGKWVSAAGYNKGVYTNAIGLAYNPDLSHRNKLYAKNINCVIQENGVGILLFGDKTLQGKNSTFSFLGTRFLFIELRRIIAEAAKSTLFEFNDDFTRAQFRDLVVPFLRDIKGKRGMNNFLVVCDKTNNTDVVIQQGKFVGDIYIKPNYSIQEVLLTFAGVNRTLSFEEAIVKNK